MASPNEIAEDETSPLLARPTAGFDSINTPSSAISSRSSEPPAAVATPAPPETQPASGDAPARPITTTPGNNNNNTTTTGNENMTHPAPAAPAVVAAPAPVTPPVPAPSPVPEAVAKADLEMAWSEPAGLRVRGHNDENLVIFRRAVGINASLSGALTARSLEEGRSEATGMYAATLTAQRNKRVAYTLITLLVYASHFMQIIIGASLTALGPSAGEHTVTITILGAFNTVMAGVLALVKGQGLPERLRQDRVEFRKLQDWIEQTEALLTVGVIGKDRKEVGLLVQIAFVKYNAAKASEENNVPENYIRATEDSPAATAGHR